MTIVVDSTAALKPGDAFQYLDLKPGGSFEVLPAVFVSFPNGGFRAPPGVEAARYK